MSARSEHHDVAVVGGGVIGLAVAWRAAQRGLRTLVLDAGEDGAWRYAAGMLAPVTEAEFGEDALLALGLRAAAGFPAFCAELEAASGRDTGLRRTGTLVVARDRDEADELERLLEHRRSLGLEVERLRPSQARRAEPALAPTVRLALDVPGDAAVDPRRLVAALAEAFERAGGELRRARVGPEDLATLPAEQIVVAAGAWSGRLGPLPIRPVKGQIMRLRDPAGQDLVTRTIRTREGYLVPRGEGRYVLGATVEERGWDTAPTSGATLELIRDLAEVVPGVLELEIEELGAGLRPGTPDNLPIIGPAAGLVWATGHYRNGILLADATAEAVVSVLAGDGLPDWAAPCDPARFAQVRA
ncbi:MAG: glycine oxidase [Solirubrobacteraceae bacterium]|nr:glycine oxidase [Solirubrobacteraceae bacterium]